MAIGAQAFFVLPAPDVLEVPLQVAQYHQIEQTVIVEIDPRGTRGPAAARYAGFLGDIRKRAVAIVMVKLVASERGDVEIFIAIVVIVAHSHTHAVAGALQA